MVQWNEENRKFLINNYPIMGKKWCAQKLGCSTNAIRAKASSLKLRLNTDSEFYKEFQSRAAKSKIGKKCPWFKDIIKRLQAEGKLKAKWTPERRKEMSDRIKIQWKTKTHPRGMSGKKHTVETREKISKGLEKRWENMSEEKKDIFSKRGALLGLSSFKNRESATWKAGWREIGGVRKYYRSRWEANYARYLEWLRKNGEIKGWEHEPETFWFEGIKRGCLSYLPDFRVTENNGKIAYHEVKGWMDDRSITKIKRMAKYHPAIKLIVIDSKQYKSIRKMISKLIPAWEAMK